MRTKFRNTIVSAMAALLVLCSVVPTAFAAVTTTYQSADYSVNKGSTWSGKTNGNLWYVDSSETRFNVSILSSLTKTVSAKLYQVNSFFPDSVIISLSLTGSSGAWTHSSYYILDHQHAHYATVYTNSTGGAKGRVSVQ